MAKAANNKVVKYFIEAKEELQKVTWPTQKETIRYTIIVIVSTLLLGAFFGLADFGFQKGLEALLPTTTSSPAVTNPLEGIEIDTSTTPIEIDTSADDGVVELEVSTDEDTEF